MMGDGLAVFGWDWWIKSLWRIRESSQFFWVDLIVIVLRVEFEDGLVWVCISKQRGAARSLGHIPADDVLPGAINNNADAGWERAANPK